VKFHVLFCYVVFVGEKKPRHEEESKNLHTVLSFIDKKFLLDHRLTLRRHPH